MIANTIIQYGFYAAVLLACVKPLGIYMARVYSGKSPLLGRFLGPVERLLYRIAGIDPKSEMTWRQYAGSLLMFSFVGLLGVYLLQRIQGFLPLRFRSSARIALRIPYKYSGFRTKSVHRK